MGEGAGRVVAYYSLAMGAVTFDEAPSWAKGNMPNPIPVVVLGRLAVDRDHQRKGLATGLLRDAFQRAIEAARHAGCRAMVVHTIDDEAIGFYAPYGFQRFPSDGRTLFLSMETLAASL
jgi:GNAT superfamily N-acetyltransferase